MVLEVKREGLVGRLEGEETVVAAAPAGVSVDNDTGPSLIHEAPFSARLRTSGTEGCSRRAALPDPAGTRGPSGDADMEEFAR